jgi:hypothetical protein
MSFAAIKQELRVIFISDHPSDYFATLKPKGRLKSHHINIIGTAHRLNCTTLTCNGYIHESLEDQGVINLSVWSLEPRSLIEQRWHNICKKNAYIDGMNKTKCDLLKENCL